MQAVAFKAIILFYELDALQIWQNEMGITITSTYSDNYFSCELNVTAE